MQQMPKQQGSRPGSPQRTRPTLVIFQAGSSPADTHLERLVVSAQQACTLDLLVTAVGTAAFEQAILVTEDTALQAKAESLSGSHALDMSLAVVSALDYSASAEGIPAPEGFHFGKVLRELCRERQLERVVYVGGGAMPLATPQALADLALAVSGPSACVVSNNLFSADLVAFYPASALNKIDPPAVDNDLAWLLHYRAGLPYAPTTHTLATHFDVDTPTDLASLWLATRSAPLNASAGTHLQTFLASVPDLLPAPSSTLERAYAVMATRRAQVFLAGRVSSWTWRRMEINLPCQTRVLSEERGMRASGRDARGEVRSLLGLYADLAGVSGLITALEQTCDAAFLDSRVLFAHKGLYPSRQERFASDAFAVESIEGEWLRSFTELAAQASIPVVLGGHSMIAGGVWALAERVRGSASSAR
jgi:hypothetical protein